jgi:hypothetical protein
MNKDYKLYQDGRFYNTKADLLEMAPLLQLTETEKKIKERFQNVIDEKEKEFAFHLNDTVFKIQP